MLDLIVLFSWIKTLIRLWVICTGKEAAAAALGGCEAPSLIRPAVTPSFTGYDLGQADPDPVRRIRFSC